MNIRSSILASVFAVVTVGQVIAGTPAENKALVEGFVSVGNSRDYDRLGEFVSQDIVRHSQATPGLAVTNLDEFKAFMVADVQVCPDSVVQIHQIVAEGERVAVWATYTGTQTGTMGPFPPSGKKMVLDFGAFFRIDGGKISELWVTWDNMAAMTQLGHYPPRVAE